MHLLPVERPDLWVEPIRDGEVPKHSLWQVCHAIGADWAKVAEEEITVNVVKGGITNCLYKVSSPVGDVLVRVYGDKTEIVIDRNKESAILQQLSALGFSVPYYGSFANGRIEGWKVMRSLEPDEMSSVSPVDFPDLIASQLCRLHALKITEPGNPNREPQLFLTIKGWAKTASQVNFHDSGPRETLYARLDVPLMMQELKWLMTVLPSSENWGGADLVASIEDADCARAAEFAFASVCCHNDMLSGNILVDSELNCQLIDFEYGCYNHRAFDIANHFVEYAGFDGDWGKRHPTDQQMLHFLKAYVKHAQQLKQLQEFADEATEAKFLTELLNWVCLFCLASHLFWGFWSIIQARYSPIDFNFLDYSRLRFVGYFYCKGLYSHLLFKH